MHEQVFRTAISLSADRSFSALGRLPLWLRPVTGGPIRPTWMTYAGGLLGAGQSFASVIPDRHCTASKQQWVHMTDLSVTSAHPGLVGKAGACLREGAWLFAHCRRALPSRPQRGSEHLVLAIDANPKPPTRHIPVRLDEVVEGALCRCNGACLHERPEPTLER